MQRAIVRDQFRLMQKSRQGTFEGYTAQIIKHEVDHCNGILI